jgi:hypothetical protein
MRADREARRDTLNAQRSFKGGRRENIIFRDTRESYVYAPPLKGATSLRMISFKVAYISLGRTKKRK